MSTATSLRGLTKFSRGLRGSRGCLIHHGSCSKTTNLSPRLFSSTLTHRDVLQQLDKQLNPREVIEKKRKVFEEKYGDKLKRRIEAEGVKDLDELKSKVMVPSVKEAIKSRTKSKPVSKQETPEQKTAQSTHKKQAPIRTVDPKKEPAQGDRSGIKPLSSILNLPLIHLTPHDAKAIATIWTSYHSLHPTLANSYLSASVPSDTYKSIVSVAKENPFFVIPLPRTADDTKVQTDSYEMFFLQWLFHPTPSDPTSSVSLPPTTSIIFTPLEEYKKAGEWAQPHLVLTHYPDLAESHGTVLMRGEISPAAATGPSGSMENPGFLLSQQQAQLLALALQRFYCSSIPPQSESPAEALKREKRSAALQGFRERPGEWSWEGLVDMAYGGLM